MLNSEVKMSDGGKGSKPRPFSVDLKKFESNWDAIFNKKEKIEESAADYSEMLCVKLVEDGKERWGNCYN
jgi:hypothetical protein